MNPTRKIAEFITRYDWSDLSLEAVERAKGSFMDYVGVTLAGVHEESAAIIRRLAEEMGGNPQATIWGSKFKTSVLLAALANGTAAHALDLDDTSAVMMAHPSIQLLPALFALGELKHATGQEIILGYIIGFEVGAGLGRAMNPDFVTQGWFPVGPLGTLMQTAACSKLLGLDTEQIENALGIAANLAAGLRCNNGTMAKPLMAGSAASSALLAVLSASDGLTANRKALEDRFGFFENFSRADTERLRQSIERLGGDPLEIIHSGPAHKLYPCCAGTHAAIDCALNIVRQHKPNPDDIKKIEVAISSGVKFLLIHPRPKTETEAKFSLEYCVARAIMDGRIGPDQFTPEKIQDPFLNAFIEKVSPKYLDRASRAVEIKVLMKDGAVYSLKVEQPKGTPANPLSRSDLERKFRQCAGNILSEERIKSVFDHLNHFERLEDVSDFIAGLA